MAGISGVGVSFGADRIYDVLNQLNLFDENKVTTTEVLILNFGEKETEQALKILDRLRRLNVSAEIYPDTVKLKKQMLYADLKKIPYIIMSGEEEIKNNEVKVKNMSTGEQKGISLEKLEDYVRSEIRTAK
jgi:histidyl-tRNA synthetase